jgi:hypothetical protein
MSAITFSPRSPAPSVFSAKYCGGTDVGTPLNKETVWLNFCEMITTDHITYFVHPSTNAINVSAFCCCVCLVVSTKPKGNRSSSIIYKLIRDHCLKFDLQTVPSLKNKSRKEWLSLFRHKLWW